MTDITDHGKYFASRQVCIEMSQLQSGDFEGFTVNLPDENNLLQWEAVIFGPPKTLYEGGYLRLLLQFPPEYPFKPPSARFLTPMWHPNIGKDGTIYVSFVHLPGNCERFVETVAERWNPSQIVRTVMLSIIALLTSPNTIEPSNVDASTMFRRWKDSNEQDKEYETTVRNLVEATKAEAARDNVTVPTTLEEYINYGKKSPKDSNDYEDDDYDSELYFGDDDMSDCD